MGPTSWNRKNAAARNGEETRTLSPGRRDTVRIPMRAPEGEGECYTVAFTEFLNY